MELQMNHQSFVEQHSIAPSHKRSLEPLNANANNLRLANDSINRRTTVSRPEVNPPALIKSGADLHTLLMQQEEQK